MPLKIKITGAQQTAAALKALGRASTQQKVLRQALRPGAAAIRTDVRGSAPVDTGQYRRSIAVGIGKQNRYGESARLYVGVKGPRKYISHILEYGSRYVSARPHFRPALARNVENVVRLFGATLWPKIVQEGTKVAYRAGIRASKRR